MSVVIAIKDKDRIVVGCDTRMSNEQQYEDGYKNRPKMVIANKTIVACVGNIGLVDIFAKKIENLNEFTREKILYEVVIPLFNELTNTCYLAKSFDFDGEIVLARGDKAFIISGNGTISEVNNQMAVGSGALASLGSLTTTFYSNKTPEERIALAIQTTSKICQTVSSESIITDTKKLTLKSM